ncbi:hypothetical protein [Deinococcus petrolearius]|uniref:Uncharacterized protein n=1 Tax=Deinococcus petrolearius TaxID=1751295 RepID=A0ABW1DFF7_9DEIO
MRNHKMLTALMALTFMTGTAFAAPNTAAAQPRTPGQTQAPSQTQQRPNQAAQVAYYKGSPLGGGQLLKTVTLTAQRGDALFQNAPQGATHAVVTTPFGRQVVNLKTAQTQQKDRGAPDQDSRTGKAAQASRAQAPAARGADDQRGGQQGERQTGHGDRGLGGLLRGATSVTFYAADPLKGGKATQTVRLGTDAQAQQAALTQAAKGARFAVVERGGEQVIVDLAQSAFPGGTGAAAPQGPQRR